MKYETPELSTLIPAINAIQGDVGIKKSFPTNDSPLPEGVAAYADWED